MTATTIPRERPEWWSLALVLVPLLTALVLGLQLRSHGPYAKLFAEHGLQPLASRSAHDLSAILDGLGYDWPPTGPVPALGARHLPSDMSTLPIDAKKRVFFKTLLPLVLAENARIEKQRTFVEMQFTGDGPVTGTPARAALAKLAKHYKIEQPLDQPAARQGLLRRLDTVPPALILAQAAKESGWGTSRFALQANNLFGVWTWDADEGLAPLAAGANARHYVRIFPDLRASVRNYLYNINVGHAFPALRKKRARLRAAGKTPTALQLARTLDRYSAQGAAYVNAIDGLIRYNRLTVLGDLDLRLKPVY